MDDIRLSPQLTVAELLAQSSRSAAVFIRFRMACVGCPLCAFETLESAALNYNVPVAVFMRELEGVIKTPTVDDE